MRLTDIIANMRSYAARLDRVGGMPSPTDLRTFADGIDAAIREENHCKKRFDEDGNEMPPHCAFQSLRLDHALAENGDLRAALVEISQMCGVGPNEVSAIAIAHICDKALRTKGE